LPEAALLACIQRIPGSSLGQYASYPKIQINQPTRGINLSDLLFVVQIQLNMFQASSCPSSGAYKLQ